MRLSIVLILLAATQVTRADEYVEWVGANSGVNWSSGEVQAEGAGVAPDGAPPGVARMMACRAAMVDAQRNLLESIQGVRVEGTTVVSNMMLESDVIKSSVEGALRGATVVSRAPEDDGSCVVQMNAPMAGQLATSVYERVFLPEDAAAWLGSGVNAALRALVPMAQAAEPATPSWRQAIDQVNARLSAIEDLLQTHPAVVEASTSGPTGLVLDARGSNFIPSMSPKIREIRSAIIYPNRQHQIARRERGQLVSLFTRDLDTARRHPVVGERPLVLKGLRTYGDTRTEIVIGVESAGRLRKLVSDGFLADSGVIIVL